ncbi:hypothetical protein Tco_0027395 [Tanacetum coccineum]
MTTTQASAQLIDDLLVPENYRFEISSANKKVDLDNLPSPAPCKIIEEILKRHYLKDALTLSASALVIYMQQMCSITGQVLHQTPSSTMANIMQKFVLAEEVEQLVEGKKEGDESDSYDTFLLNQEDPGNSLAFGSHKESPEEMVNVIDDDNDDDQHNIDALIRMKKSGSSELRDAKMQTPILTTPRSPRTNLYSDKGPIIKLMETNDHMSHIPS